MGWVLSSGCGMLWCRCDDQLLGLTWLPQVRGDIHTGILQPESGVQETWEGILGWETTCGFCSAWTLAMTLDSGSFAGAATTLTVSCTNLICCFVSWQMASSSPLSAHKTLQLILSGSTHLKFIYFIISNFKHQILRFSALWTISHHVSYFCLSKATVCTKSSCVIRMPN